MIIQPFDFDQDDTVALAEALAIEANHTWSLMADPQRTYYIERAQRALRHLDHRRQLAARPPARADQRRQPLRVRRARGRGVAVVQPRVCRSGLCLSRQRRERAQREDRLCEVRDVEPIEQ